MEQGTQELELLVWVAKSVAMCKEEHLAVYLGGEWLLMEYHTALLLKVVVGPDVVVAGEIVHFYPHVGEFGEFAEKACVTSWHDIFVFVPEVEHVAE